MAQKREQWIKHTGGGTFQLRRQDGTILHIRKGQTFEALESEIPDITKKYQVSKIAPPVAAPAQEIPAKNEGK